jgi:hypothetical protein
MDNQDTIENWDRWEQRLIDHAFDDLSDPHQAEALDAFGSKEAYAAMRESVLASIAVASVPTPKARRRVKANIDAEWAAHHTGQKRALPYVPLHWAAAACLLFGLLGWWGNGLQEKKPIILTETVTTHHTDTLYQTLPADTVFIVKTKEVPVPQVQYVIQERQVPIVEKDTIKAGVKLEDEPEIMEWLAVTSR